MTGMHALRMVMTSAVAMAVLSGCGGGGTSGSGGGLVSVTPTPSPAPSTPTPTPVTSVDAVRLAQQATFGPTPEVVNRIVALGITGWIDEQLAATGSRYDDIAASTAALQDFCTAGAGSTDTACNRKYFSREPVAMRFYADAMNAPDQLKQRVAFALSQVLVASELEVNETNGIAAYQQILLDGAFGNYRDILQNVTLSGYMGDYLDMADSNRTAPSENYARELLQLFSIGPDQLNMDGTRRLDATGAAIPNYTTDDIKGVAKALTGWTYARLGSAALTDNNARDYSKPMVQVAARYDTTAKTFMGTTVPAGATQADSVKAVVDAAFNNASTAPFVAKSLIQQLVTSNPSPAYVGRVAAKFADNGSGIRGDMKAVVRAILTDAEARGGVRSGAGDGKVKEPILTLTATMRVVGFSTDGYPFVTQDAGVLQGVFRSGSVFNFYPPDYPLPGNTTLRSGPSKLITTSNVIRLHNLIYNWTVSGDQARSEFTTNPGIPGWTGSSTTWTAWEALDTAGMIDRINLLMMANTMSDAQKAALTSAASAITNATPSLQSRRRAQMLLYIVATSPQFQVDR
ncbi:DUF1800 domain-containing protein [Sphingomonas donggukensis]|uniref:DUF1800 domain-containing protein n=1 Tax=Sphingomonas donggukensis TaxID=2949093 RepID=A0ABY4TUE6_9SPHN|nr:DUF1800 domain-containing protein [Sphingomonas donggukensis]URW76028.1 DUF1800 domain-containing protein [Sphingomonas donggukensis]